MNFDYGPGLAAARKQVESAGRVRPGEQLVIAIRAGNSTVRGRGLPWIPAGFFVGGGMGLVLGRDYVASGAWLGTWFGAWLGTCLAIFASVRVRERRVKRDPHALKRMPGGRGMVALGLTSRTLV